MLFDLLLKLLENQPTIDFQAACVLELIKNSRLEPFEQLQALWACRYIVAL